MAIVAGHTARYDGTDYPMVGGATVMAIGPKDKYITPAMARVGDVVIVTKGAAIEATGLFAATFPAEDRRALRRRSSPSGRRISSGRCRSWRMPSPRPPWACATTA